MQVEASRVVSLQTLSAWVRFQLKLFEHEGALLVGEASKGGVRAIAEGRSLALAECKRRGEMTARDYQRTPFGRTLLRHALRDRARRETGFPESRTSPIFDDWSEGIHEWVRAQTVAHVEERNIRLHDHAAAVNSSMAFAFNLFMPFREYGASALEAALKGVLGFRVRVIAMTFEFHGPTDVLAECAGTQPADDEKFTASDVAIQLEDDSDRTGVVLVEVKLSEGGYTHCNGATSKSNTRKDVCAAADRFFEKPHTCYLTRPRHARRDRRYWDILKTEFGSVRGAVPAYSGKRCPFEGNYQQLMRNHALTLGLVQAGKAAFTAFGLVHHPGNQYVVEPWDDYRSTVADPSPLFRIPADVLVDAAARQAAPWPAWARYMRERYMLPIRNAGA